MKNNLSQLALGKIVGLMLLSVFLISCGTTGVKKVSKTSGKAINKPEKIEAVDSADFSDTDQSQYRQARNYLSKEDYKRAERLLTKLAGKHTGHFGVHLNLATTLFRQGQLEQALAHCEAALSINGNIAQAYNLRGLIAVKNKQFQTAESKYQKAIALDKSYANAHYNLALLYDIYYQDIDKAYLSYQEYLRLVPDDKITADWLEQLKFSLEQN